MCSFRKRMFKICQVRIKFSSGLRNRIMELNVNPDEDKIVSL